jgi:hypothetical protein
MTTYNFKQDTNIALNPLMQAVQQINMDYSELAMNPYNIISSFKILPNTIPADYWTENEDKTAVISITKRKPTVGNFKKTSRQNASTEKMGFEFYKTSASLAREEISLEVTERELSQNDPQAIIQRSSVSFGGAMMNPNEMILGSGLAVGLVERVTEKVIYGDENSRELGLVNIEKQPGVISFTSTTATAASPIDENSDADAIKAFVMEMVKNWQSKNPNPMQFFDEIFVDLKYQTIFDSVLLSDYHLISAFEYYISLYAGRKNKEVIGKDGIKSIEWLDQKDITIKYIQGLGDKIIITKKQSSWGGMSTISLLVGNKGVNYGGAGYVNVPLDFKNAPNNQKSMFKPYIIDDVNRRVLVPLQMWWGGLVIMQEEFIQVMNFNSNAKKTTEPKVTVTQ